MSRLVDLLAALQETATAHGDLAATLEAMHEPKAAQRLRAGDDLPTALTGLIDRSSLTLLTISSVPLQVRLAVLLDRVHRRQLLFNMTMTHLGGPILMVIVVGLMALFLAMFLDSGPLMQRIGEPLWAIVPACVFVICLLAPWLPRRWHLPGSGWARQSDLAQSWSRAALAVRWRLSEAEAERLLHVNLDLHAAVLGNPGAEQHCALLAAWHDANARRRLAITHRVLAALVLCIGGALVLGSVRIPNISGL